MDQAKPRHSANVRRVSVYSTRRASAASSTSTSTSAPTSNAPSGPHPAAANSKPAGRSGGGASAHGKQEPDDGHVQVAVRCRPMSDKELAAGYEPIVEFESERRVVVHDSSEQPSDQLGTKSGERRNISHVYDFDRVFDWNSSQRDIYDQVCRPIVESALEGFNGTIFAYGQTGTGKTYTMEGQSHKSRELSGGAKGGRRRRRASSSSGRQQVGRPADEGLKPAGEQDNLEAGIIPRTFEQIFDHVARNRSIQFLIRASYLEIYQEEIRDLLNRDKANKLELHERSDVGVYVKDLTSFVCKSIGEIERVMRVGNQNRIVAATDMNEYSSRSHAIFMITIEQLKLDTKLQAAGPQVGGGGGGGGVIRVGKLNLVDLAGSERQRKTNSFGQRQKESIKINLSLSALGNVINSLMKQQQQPPAASRSAGAAAPAVASHTPYRDSKLTRLLQDSLGGNAKTLMIANVGPASYNYDETINTLDYASRARCIKNRPRLNEDPKDALLRELQREIDLLRAKLALGGAKSGPANQTGASAQSSGVSSAKSSTISAGASEIGGQQNNNRQLLVEREFIELKQKLASLEGKLLNSDHAFSHHAIEGTCAPPNGPPAASQPPGDHTQSILQGLNREQELELSRRQDELARQASRERAIRDELERREEAELLAKQSFQSIQQEIEAKRRLIWQVLLKVKSARDEAPALQRAYRIELDDLEQLQFVLQRELKLKCLMMDNFIPNEHVDQLLPRVAYDETRNLCAIEPLELAGDQAGGCLLNGRCRFAHFWSPTLDDCQRPKSEFERISEAIYPSNIRYKYEDLLEPSLFADGQSFIGARQAASCSKPRRLGDKPHDHEPNNSRPRPGDDSANAAVRLQALIDGALDQREPDIVI